MTGYRHADELAALLSPRVRAAADRFARVAVASLIFTLDFDETLRPAGALAGLLILTAVVAMEGIADVAHILEQAGWPLLWLVPIHLIALWFDAYGWRVLLAPADPEKHAGTGFLLWVATVREAVTRLLPTAGIGGELVGIRLAWRRVPDSTAVSASIVIEVMVTMFSHYLFAGRKVLLLISITQDSDHGLLVAIGLLLSLPIPRYSPRALRHGAWFTRLESFRAAVLGDDHKLAALIDGARLDAQIRALCRHYGVLVRTLIWQMTGLVVGTLEVWWGLSLLGHPVSFGGHWPSRR
jgi:putative membrane protein